MVAVITSRGAAVSASIDATSVAGSPSSRGGHGSHSGEDDHKLNKPFLRICKMMFCCDAVYLEVGRGRYHLAVIEDNLSIRIKLYSKWEPLVLL